MAASITWQDLYGLNPHIGSDPNKINPGDNITLPDGTSYTVVRGDTLSGIANRFNKEQANREVNPANNLALDPDSNSTPVTKEEDSKQTQVQRDPYEDTPANPEPAYKEVKSDITVKPPAIQVGGTKTASIYNDPIENPLNAYASYTYGITLHVLTREDYNTMTKNPRDFKPTKTLISSASRYQGTRDPEFGVDFYFDSLKMETIIGPSANSRGTNAIKIDFTIVEPYGMTLLDRIMHVNNSGLNGKNYLDMPYLLEINFFGQDDTGKSGKIKDQTKWLPIKLISFKIKAGVKGTEYAVEAVPFNHGANMESIQAIKARFEITSGTVKDYFANDTDTATQKAVDDAMNEDKKRKEKAKNAEAERAAAQERANATAAEGDQSGAGELDSLANGNPGVREPVNASSDQQASGSTDSPISVKTKSFTAAYNAWNAAEKKNNTIGYADQIRFEIDEEIANSSIVEPKKNSPADAASTDAKTVAKSTGDNRDATPATTVDLSTTVHSLEPGTTVNEVINLVIPTSSYLLKQANDSSTQSKAAGGTTSNSQDATPVKMWKIIPSIELRDFDPERNEWGKTITFHIKKYNVYNSRDSRLPKSVPPPPVKRYDYLYSGHNKAIINFDLDFNALYYTAKDVDRNKTSKTQSAGAQDTGGDNKEKPESNAQPNQIAQEKVQVVSNTMQTTAGGATAKGDSQNAQSAVQGIYTSAGGDMITLKLQIIGDPHFIKQDDLFINPKLVDDSQQFVPGTGSLNMDRGELFCYVTFKSPSDFSDQTGLYNLNSKEKYYVSEFSGYYKILRVESEFRNGKFTQNVEMIRQPKQDPINLSVTAAAQSRSAFAATDPRRLDLAINNKANNPAVNAADTEKPVTPTRTVQAPAKTEDANSNAGPLVTKQADENQSDAETARLASVAKSSEPPRDITQSGDPSGNTKDVQSN